MYSERIIMMIRVIRVKGSVIGRFLVDFNPVQSPKRFLGTNDETKKCPPILEMRMMIKEAILG